MHGTTIKKTHTSFISYSLFGTYKMQRHENI